MGEINWNQLQKDADDVLLPDGDYPVIITKADAVTSSTGKPMIKVQGTITGGPKKDRKIFTQLTLTADNPFALKMWFNQLAAIGLDAAYFGRNPAMDQVAKDLVNRGALFTVSSREWQGSPRNQVDAIKAFPAGQPLPPGMVTGAATAGPTGMTPSASPVPSTPPSPNGPPTPVAAPSAPPTPPAF